MVRAFERLKKEGLVKHLAISQHHYNNIGGDMAWEILDYLADHQPYDATQFFYTYGDRKEVQEWIDVAKKKDIATIAMKTMGGVGRAANDEKFRKLLARPEIPGQHPRRGDGQVAEVEREPHRGGDRDQEFRPVPRECGRGRQRGHGPAGPRGARPVVRLQQGIDLPAVRPVRLQLAPNTSRIADIFRYERYARDYHDLDRARREYAALTRNGTSCVGCGDCLPACSQEIDIAAKLKDVQDVHRLLG